MADEDPFDAYKGDFTLKDVEVELHHVDSSYVEGFDLKALNCSETRCLEWSYTGDGESEGPPTLTYLFFFETPDCAEPKDGFSGTECSVVIRGTHANGCRLEITGQAWPYVNIKAFELNGVFDDPPKIAILSGLPDMVALMPDEDEKVVQLKRA